MVFEQDNGEMLRQAALASDLLPDGLVFAGRDALITHVNRRATEIVGVAPGELLGQDVRTAVQLQDNLGNSWWDYTDPWHGLNIRTGHRERLLMLANGNEVLVTARYLRPGRNQPVSRVVVALRDADGRRREEANHAALISTVAHELRSPLTSVKGFSSTLLRRWDKFSDDQKRLMIETIEADADRVTRLITELLDVSRIDSGRLQLRTQPIDVGATFDRHVERFVASGQEPDKFQVEVAPSLPEVWADPDRLDQILANLIENALRHGDGTVRLAALPADDSVLGPGTNGHGPERAGEEPESALPVVDLLVSDEGPGIPEENRRIIFSRFWHGSARGSTGLGLYLVKGLVEAHGGRVVVEDSPSGGAQFRFALPAGPPDYLL
jgi:signal transduction histidine kinase